MRCVPENRLAKVANSEKTLFRRCIFQELIPNSLRIGGIIAVVAHYKIIMFINSFRRKRRQALIVFDF